MSLPGISTVPGSLLLGNLREFSSDRVGLLLRAAKLGPLARITLGPVSMVLVNDPELAHEVLVTGADHYHRVPMRGMYGTRRLFGQGLLVSEGALHKAQRTRTLSAFKAKLVADHIPTMAAVTHGRLSRWADGAVLDLSAELGRLVLAISTATLFGADLGSDADEVIDAITTAVSGALAELGTLVHLPLWVPTSANVRFRQAIAVLDTTVENIIAERRNSSTPRRDLLAALMSSTDETGTTMSDTQLRDEVKNLLVAGYEAMVSSLVWSLYHLARDPALYDAVRDEADSGKSSRFELCQRVLSEAIRLYPAGHIMLRRASSGTSLAGNTIPKGQMVAINGMAIHRRASAFERTDEFLPERFLHVRHSPKDYLPFGVGPMSCVGAHYALVEGATVLSVLSRRVRFELVDAQAPRLHAGFAIMPRGGLLVRARMR